MTSCPAMDIAKAATAGGNLRDYGTYRYMAFLTARYIDFLLQRCYNFFGGINMELRVLNYFLAIAREENITRAAKQLHVTQPTLSRQIADLEAELGVKLFTRSNHSIVLTDDGLLLKRRAQEILTLADKTMQDFLNKEEKLEGTITIGSGEFLSTRILTDCIASFRSKYPNIRYEIFSGNAGNIKDGIERGLLDMGLMAEPIDIRKYEFITMPVREEWGALVRDDSPLAARTQILPQDLVGLPLISAISDIAESNLRKWLEPVLGEVDVIAKGDLLYNEAMLAQSNIGAVLAMRLNCRYDGLRFVPFAPELEGTTALAWKKEHIFSPAAATFIQFAKKYISGISRDNR